MARIYHAGEMEAETKALYEREGIPLNETTIADLQAVAASLDVAVPELD